MKFKFIFEIETDEIFKWKDYEEFYKWIRDTFIHCDAHTELVSDDPPTSEIYFYKEELEK